MASDTNIINIIDDSYISLIVEETLDAQPELNIKEEAVEILEIASQGLPGASTSLTVDTTNVSGNIEFVAGNNIDLDIQTSPNKITINSSGAQVTSVNGRTGAVLLNTADISEYVNKNYVNDIEKHNIGTIPDLALRSEIPTIPTIPTLTSQLTNDSNFETSINAQLKVDTAVATLKGGVATSGDTLFKLKEFIDNLQLLLDSDDVNLDTIQKIVTYVKNNKTILDGVVSDKVNISNIIDDLLHTDVNKPLSANQGKVLKGFIDTLTTNMSDKLNTSLYTASDVMSKVTSQLDSTHRFVTDDEKTQITHGETSYGWGSHFNLLSTGLLTGGELTINATDDSKIDISAGTGVVVNNYTNPLNPTRTIVSWNDKLSVTIPNIATVDTTIIGINIDGDVVFRGEEFTSEERRDIISLGWCDHTDNTHISIAYNEPEWVPDVYGQLADFLSSFGSFNIDGNDYYAASGLRIRRTSGKTFDCGTNYINTKKSVNILPTNAENPIADIYYYHRNSSGVWVNNNPAVLNIDPGHYDTPTGLASVANDKWTIQIIEFYAPTRTTDIQYGQVIYNSYEEARSALTSPITMNPYNNFDTFRAWLIVRGNATDLTDSTQAVFVPAGKLGLISVGSGGGSGGEVNTASNQGLSGVGLYNSKLGVDLQFKNINAGSNKITITDDTVNKTVNIDVNSANIKSSLNLTKSDVGLSLVENSADASKNVLSSTKLTTARNINGVSFDGTANITIVDSTKEPIISTKNTAFNKNYETSAINIKMNGTQSVGSSDTIARGDHVHPVDTSRASTAIATTSANGLMSSSDKTKIDGIANGAEVNVNADWNSSSGDSQILNKPTIPSALSDLTADATHRFVTDTEKSTWNSKQDTLVSGTNLKTINGTSLLGSGDLVISGSGGGITIAQAQAISAAMALALG